MLYGSNSLFHNFPNKEKVKQHISEMPFSRNTAKDQVLWMAGNIGQQLTTDLQKAACYYICLDESTDVNTNAICKASNNFALCC